MMLALMSGPGIGQDFPPRPGRYRIEVNLSLPNVLYRAEPLIRFQCLTPATVADGTAFAILSENPLRACGITQYTVGMASITYRVACHGPNTGYALARFEIAMDRYEGTIHMNMGGKNMTVVETQAARRMGDCP